MSFLHEGVGFSASREVAVKSLRSDLALDAPEQVIHCWSDLEQLIQHPAKSIDRRRVERIENVLQAEFEAMYYEERERFGQGGWTQKKESPAIPGRLNKLVRERLV